MYRVVRSPIQTRNIRYQKVAVMIIKRINGVLDREKSPNHRNEPRLIIGGKKSMCFLKFCIGKVKLEFQFLNQMGRNIRRRE